MKKSKKSKSAKMMMREKDMYAMMPRSPDEMPKRMRKMKGKMR